MAHHNLDSFDKKIHKLIAEDARMPFLEVARVCNVSGAAIHQRIQKLSNQGVLKGSKFNIDPEKIGYETCAFIGINLKHPENFDEVVEKLKRIPEIVECHYCTGPYNVLIKVYARDNQHLMELLNDRIQSINGVTGTETLISLDQSINREIPIEYEV